MFDSLHVLNLLTVLVVVGLGVFCLIALFVSLTHGHLADDAQAQRERRAQQRRDHL